MPGNGNTALYRLHAAQCIDVAERTADAECKLALLAMARRWMALAEQSERNDHAETLVYETPPERPASAGPQRPPDKSQT